MMQPTLVNLHPNEYSQELHYYPFAVKLDRCAGCCSILNGSSNKVCFPNKTADLNLSVSNMITGINECLCKCKFDGRKHNSNQKCYNDKCWWECKKHHICEKSYTWNPVEIILLIS